MTGSAIRVLRAARRGAPAGIAVAVFAGLLMGAMPPPAYTGKIWSPFPLGHMASVPGQSVAPGAAAAARRADLARLWRATSRAGGSRPVRYVPGGTRWPAAGTGMAAMGSAVPATAGRIRGSRWVPARGWQRAGGLPVRVKAAGGLVAGVAAAVAARPVTRVLGVRGVVLSVTPSAGTGRLRMALSYSGFGGMFGGGWASRLRLVELPGCALTSPRLARCRVERPVASVNDWRSHQVTTVIIVGGQAAGRGAGGARPARGAASEALAAGPGRPSIGAGGTVVLAATSGPSGPTGDFTATPLRPSGTWAEQQGAFTYSYPIATPPALAGAAPAVGLSYNSQAVDSETSGSNTQGGFIGDGWDYTPGFIERSYQGCSHDGIAGSGDECWGGANATLSLGAHSSQLVLDSTGTWHLKSDDGTKVQLQTGAGNGLWNGEYWVVTTTDGTKYYFGADHIPGGSGSDPSTNAAWGEPVYNPDSGDPCYDSAKGQSSECFMGWRWNLDFSVDAMKRVIVYNYAAETNYYSMGGGQNGGNGTLTQYVRGGYPTEIDYGYLLPDAIAGAKAAAKIVFGASERCLSDQATCDANHDSTHWPDVPWDQNCGSSGSCTNYSPTFWSTQRLTSVTTKVLESGSYRSVDSWALAQSFPVGAGSSPVMELDTITRTGLDGGTLALPAVTFTTAEFDNRVDGSLNSPPVYRPRITGIATEAGDLISVTYQPAGCSRLNGPMPAHDYTNTLPCFPVYWTPPGQGQIQDWFLKSLVSQVAASDQTGAGSPAQLTTYSYLGNIGWHYDDNPLVPAANRTWDNYRGFQQIKTTTGGAPDPVTQEIQTYMQGMDGDNNGTGGTRSVQVQDPAGDPPVTDSDWLAGSVLETDTYTASGGSVVKREVDGWSYDQTADQSQPGSLPDLTAHMIATSTDTTESLFAGGTWHNNVVTTHFNASALPVAVDQNPDASARTCTTTAYATPPSGNAMMLDYADQVTTVTGGYSSGSCPASSSSNIVSDSRTYYDDASSTLSSMGTFASLSYPGGLPTGAKLALSWPSGGSETWQAKSATGYDSLGRVTSVTTPTPNGASGTAQTSTAYTPSYTAGAATELPTEIDVTNAMGWKTKTAFGQGREQPVTVTDPNGEVTTEAYDPLGRRSYVITPADQASGDHSITFAYSITGTTPPAVTTSTLREDGSYRADVKIYDGMLQLRQEQVTPGNAAAGRLLTDMFYDSHGWVVKSRDPYYDSTTAPGTSLFIAGDGSIPGWTATSYDGTGRPAAETFESGNAAQWSTTTAYPGLNEADVTPPPGGTATSSFTNVLGQVTASWKYTTATPDGNSAHADVTSYTYTPAGLTAQVTDNAGNKWTYGYDLAGQKTSSTSPESTASSSWSYDAAGNIASTTDPRGQQISWAYDLAGRQVTEFSGTLSGTKLAAWAYDTAPLNGGAGAKGQLASATSYDTAGGASGPYTQTVTGYNAGYQPTGTSTAIPAKDLIPGATGTDTFTTTSTYAPLTGLLQSIAYSADQGLPAETVNYSYDLQGELTATGGATAYLDQAIYDPLGQLQRTTYGLFGKQLVQTYTRDPGTTWLTGVTTNLQTLSSAADTIAYTYNPAGDLTSATDTQNTGGTQAQCYSFNQLGELTAAWTDTKGTTTQPAPSVTGIGGCVTTTPSASTIGGAAPYWQTYSYDLLGDRTQAVFHDVSGNTANDLTQTSTYPGGGTTSATRPDAPTTIVTRRGASGGPSTTLTAGYDATGNTTSRTVTATSGSNPPAGPPAQSAVTYNPAGLTAKVTTSGGTSGYTYDASGTLLLQTGPTGNTLYLDGGAEQLTWNKSTGKVTAQRYYAGPDGVTIVRSFDNGSGKTTITDETTTPERTATEAIDATTQAITRRYYDPYGGPVGASPSSWPDNHAYLGKPADSNTGLDLLGARNYDPVSGRFLSPDPIFRAGDPLAMGSYAYADNNPVTNSDPSGMMFLLVGGGGGGGSSAPTFPSCPAYVAPPAPASGGGFWSWVPSPVRHFVGDFVGGVKDTAIGMVKGAINMATTPLRDAWHCGQGSWAGCGNLLLDAIGVRPAMQMTQGLVGTVVNIYHDFATGHTGRALGTITTFAVVILLTRGVGTEADAAAASDSGAAGAVADTRASVGDTSTIDKQLIDGERAYQAQKEFDDTNMSLIDASDTMSKIIDEYDKLGKPVQPTHTEQPVSAPGTGTQAGPAYGTGTVNDPITPAVIATVGIVRIIQLWIRDTLRGGKM